MRDSAESSLDVTEELERALQRWIGLLAPGVAVMRRRSTPGGYDQFEILPSEPGASRILIHEDDEPGHFKVYLGQGTWWDRIAMAGSIVDRICHAVARGHFTE